MASLPLLSSRDGVEVVAALLGYARAAPPTSEKIKVLDRIFDEVVDSLRLGLPLRAEIEAGTAAVASLLNALHGTSEPHHNRVAPPSAPVIRRRTLPPQFPNNARASQHSSSISAGSSVSLPNSSKPVVQQHAIRDAQRFAQAETPQVFINHAQQPRDQQHTQSAQPHQQRHARQPRVHSEQRLETQVPSTSNVAAPQIASAATSYQPSAPTASASPQVPGQSASATDATTSVSRANAGAPTRRTVRRKRYHDASPSSHCHVCCRPSSAVAVATCSNFKQGTCRKVVCNRCIVDNGWNWEEANSKSSTWICPHCTDSCTQVPRAQCYVYMRTNSRRRMLALRKRMRTTATVGAAAGTEQPVGNGGVGNSQSIPAPSKGVKANNGPMQTAGQGAATYGPAQNATYGMDYRPSEEVVAAANFVPGQIDMATERRQSGGNAGGAQANRGSD